MAYHIKVNALFPGLAASDMHWAFVESDAKSRGISFEEMKTIELEEIPLGRYGCGADLDGAIMWLTSKSGEYVTGQLINVNGGLDFTWKHCGQEPAINRVHLFSAGQ